MVRVPTNLGEGNKLIVIYVKNKNLKFMKYTKTLLTILVISIFTTLFSFMVDSDPSNESFITTVFELTMISLFFFVMLTTLYLVAMYTYKIVNKSFF